MGLLFLFPSVLAPREVGLRFHALLNAGTRLREDDRAQADPTGLLRTGYAPSYSVELFDTTALLAEFRERFLVAYVIWPRPPRAGRTSTPAFSTRTSRGCGVAPPTSSAMTRSCKIGKGEVEYVTRTAGRPPSRASYRRGGALP